MTITNPMTPTVDDMEFARYGVAVSSVGAATPGAVAVARWWA